MSKNTRFPVFNTNIYTTIRKPGHLKLQIQYDTITGDKAAKGRVTVPMINSKNRVLDVNTIQYRNSFSSSIVSQIALLLNTDGQFVT